MSWPSHGCRGVSSPRSFVRVMQYPRPHREARRLFDLRKRWAHACCKHAQFFSNPQLTLHSSLTHFQNLQDSGNKWPKSDFMARTSGYTPCIVTVCNKLYGRSPQYAPPLQVDLWPFDLESGFQVTCDVGCANFSLPRPLCSRLRPDVCNRETEVRRASSLNAPALEVGV